jgi:subtilisin-like proprotein convertase family protein
MPRITGHTPRIPVSQLKGQEIKPEEKVVQTRSHEITLATQTDGTWLPDLKMKRREIADPEPRALPFDLNSVDLAHVKTGEDFKAALDKLMEENKEWLKPDKQALWEKLPEADRSQFAYINITGQRTEAFFDHAMKLVARADVTGNEAKEARQAINLAHRDAYRGRTVDFDKADTGTYWSYGHDAPFVHVFEKMLETMAEDDPKRKYVQNQIDFIFTHKYVDTGKVDEYDCEKSLGLVAIDKKSRAMVSMTKDSEDTNFVKYETLTVPEGVGGDHAGKHAYRDGDAYYFQGTTEKVPDDVVGKLQHKEVETIVFARASGAKVRSGFKYDWNGNRMLNVDRINTGWWGHCDIKALMETILADMAGSGGVTEYNAASDKQTEFSRAMQLEALSAMLNFDDAYYNTKRGGKPVMLGETDFAGARFDDRPSKLVLKTGYRKLDLDLRLSSLSDKEDPSKTVPLDDAFALRVADEKRESFTENKAILRTDNGDVNYIDASDRVIKGQTDGYTFDERGRPVELKANFTIGEAIPDGTDPSTVERILISSELADIRGRKVQRIYLDPVTKELSEVSATFKKNDEGKYVAEEGSPKKIGKLSDIEIGREMTKGDDVADKVGMLEEALRTGGKIATDSSKREEVWNGEVHGITLKTEWRSDDGLWERVAVEIDATFGTDKVGTILNKLDAEGNVIDSMEIEAAVDFYWKDRPRVAPLVSERGNWYVNKSMYDRGVVALGDEMMASLGAVTDMNDLIYLGLKARDNEKLFTIVHEGKRLVYTDKAAWEADIKKLKGENVSGEQGGDDTPPATGPIALTHAPNVSIPDNDPAGIEDTLSVDRDGKIKSISIDLDVKHTWVGDLNIVLVSPDGEEIKLHKRGGRGRDDIVGRFGGDGELKAYDDLASLVGKDVRGDWKLKINDMAGQDVGTLVSWGLNIETE